MSCCVTPNITNQLVSLSLEGAAPESVLDYLLQEDGGLLIVGVSRQPLEAFIYPDYCPEEP